ncbi:MAG: hypothetical protein ABIS50_26525 [Luteolibacter sp.]|uniref:hypothetical protein n=1 Tax=Luteolibacter sp. TaxID=1962973 RepID=UPI00326473C6
MKSAIRFLAVALGAWGLLHGVSQIVRISPGWPLWISGAAIAATVELLLWLYRYEAGAVTRGRARCIIGLRLLALAVLVWILIEPVWVRKVERETKREVVVVMDDSGSMQLKDDGTEATRIAIGEAALAKSKIVEKLRETMRVRVVKAARSVQAEGEKVAEGWGDSTDLASALGTVLEQVPPDELAGVVMVSDGRHNRPERVEDVARRFGILDAPVGVVAVGSEEPPKDASILSVRAPEAIHLGDRMRVSVDLKFDGYKGQTAKVYLRRGDKILESREVSIPQDHHREEIRFAQVPEQGGVNDYRVQIGDLEGERFKENNHWDFETSITDARTNVLIVENYPRWEFRYLRNLFYGRDKSVHLQYVLMNPDQISYQSNAAVPASASRPFGDALATRLPVSEEEWRKFDVIILGDVDAKAIDGPTWQIISRCVNERAALLVMIAGPRAMPHAIDSEAGRALVPAEMEFNHRNYFNEGGDEFRFSLTPEGQRHPVTQQSDGETANERVWSEFPALNWRHPVTGLKEGAEVLLTAASGDEHAAVVSGAGLTSALDDLAKRREREAKTALLVTRQTGKGKVALLLTDRTWRLREGAGDLYHHRFWGNLVRWGAGPVLRSGGARARLGTDQLTYTPDDRVKVTARLRDQSLKPVDDNSLQAEILSEGKVLSSVPLTAVENSNGLYEANLERFTKGGKYEIRLRGDKADTLIKEDGAKELKTGFQVVGSRGPIELAETTLNRPLLETIAGLSGGKVVSPDKTADLAALFLTEKNQRDEIRESSLWDSGWLLGLLAILLGSEWVIRRAGGLP